LCTSFLPNIVHIFYQYVASFTTTRNIGIGGTHKGYFFIMCAHFLKRILNKISNRFNSFKQVNYTIVTCVKFCVRSMYNFLSFLCAKNKCVIALVIIFCVCVQKPYFIFLPYYEYICIIRVPLFCIA